MVDDRLWGLIAPLIPPQPPLRGPRGRPRIEDRAVLEGILFVLHTGCRWRDLPPALGCGSGHTAWRRLREWQEAEVWEKLHQAVLEAKTHLGRHRWVMERTISWVLRFKRLGLRYDRTEAALLPLLLVAVTLINLRRLHQATKL